MTVQPLFENILVKPLVPKKDTDSKAIVLPDSLNQDDVIYADVIAIGEGEILPVTITNVSGIPELAKSKIVVKKGDHVVFKKYSGTPLPIDKEKHFLVNQRELLAIISE